MFPPAPAHAQDPVSAHLRTVLGDALGLRGLMSPSIPIPTELPKAQGKLKLQFPFQRSELHVWLRSNLI